jgi:hypothetical protein
MAKTRVLEIVYRIVNRWLLCAAFVTAIMGWSVTPVTAACIDVNQWRSVIVAKTENMDIAPAEQMTPELLAFVVGRYNATPPTNKTLRPDAGYMLLGRVKPTGMPFGDVAFGLFEKGCLIGTFIGQMPHASKPDAGEPI